MGSAVVLDFRHKRDGERITVADVRRALEKIRYEMNPLDIVLFQRGADAACGTPEYRVRGHGMDRESTLWLLEKGVKVVGIDAWSWDRPLPFLAEEFERIGDPRVHGLLFPRQGEGGERGVVPSGCHHRRMTGR